MSEADLTRWAGEASLLMTDESSRDRARFIAATVGRQASRMGLTKDDVGRWLQSAYGTVWVAKSRSRLDPGMDMKEVRKEIFRSMDSVEPNPIPPPPAGRGTNRGVWFEKTFPVGTPVIFKGSRNISIGDWSIPDGVKGEVVEIHPYELQIRLFPPMPGDPRFQKIQHKLDHEGKGESVEDLDIYVSIDGAVSGIVEPLTDTWGDEPTHTPRYRMPHGRRARLKPNPVTPAKLLRPGDVIEYRELYKVEIISGPQETKDKLGRGMLEFQAEIVDGPDRIGDSGPMIFGSDGVVKKVARLKPNRARPLKGAAMSTRFGEDVGELDGLGGPRGRQLDDAMDRYETFHKKAPIRVAELKHDLPKSWVPVGDALAVMYRTDKWKKDGTDIDYKHLHDKGEDKPYDLGKGVKFYEPSSEANKSQVQGRRTSRPGKKRPQRLSVGNPEALTLLGYCLGVFVKRYDDERVYEVNPRGCYLFSSPSGNMLALYSSDEQPDGSSGFLAAMSGGNLRVLKDGIDG